MCSCEKKAKGKRNLFKCRKTGEGRDGMCRVTIKNKIENKNENEDEWDDIIILISRKQRKEGERDLCTYVHVHVLCTMYHVSCIMYLNCIFGQVSPPPLPLPVHFPAPTSPLL